MAHGELYLEVVRSPRLTAGGALGVCAPEVLVSKRELVLVRRQLTTALRAQALPHKTVAAMVLLIQIGLGKKPAIRREAKLGHAFAAM